MAYTAADMVSLVTAPFGGFQLHHISEKQPKNWPKMAQILHSFGCTASQSRMRHIVGSVAQKLILRAPSPPTNPLFFWFPPLQIAQNDA